MNRPGTLRIREAAWWLSVSERTVRRWVADGVLASVRIGGTRLVFEDDVRAFLETRSQYSERRGENRSSSTKSTS